MRTVDAGTGDEIAACMKMMLQEHEGLWQNTRCLITDRCPAQVSANRKIVALMNQDRDATNQVYQVACLMHTVLGSDNRSGACLSEDTKHQDCCECPEADFWRSEARLLQVGFT